MLDRGAILNKAIDGEMISPALRYVASKGHLEVVRLLVSRGAVINWHGRTPLTAAIENNHHDVVEYLRQHCAKTSEEMRTSRPPAKPLVLNEEVVSKGEAFFGTSDPAVNGALLGDDGLQFRIPIGSRRIY